MTTATTKDILHRLADTDHRRRLVADRIFRELRKTAPLPMSAIATHHRVGNELSNG